MLFRHPETQSRRRPGHVTRTFVARTCFIPPIITRVLTIVSWVRAVVQKTDIERDYSILWDISLGTGINGAVV